MSCRFVSEADKDWFSGCMMQLVEEQLGVANRTALEHDDVFVDFMRCVYKKIFCIFQTIRYF